MSQEHPETRTFRLDKLVRDRIVADTEAQGGVVRHEKLSGQELIDALIDKLQEELSELRYGEEPTLEKLADIREIVREIAITSGHQEGELNEAQIAKRKKIGGFELGHFVHIVTLPADNKWAKYYAADPERFPEVEK